MPKFEVMLQETITYVVLVDAEHGDEAQDIAVETWNQSENPNEDFTVNCGQGVTPLWWQPADV